MLRSTVIIIFTLSIFVGRVCLTTQKEGQISTSTVIPADAKNASGTLIKNNTSTVEPTVKLEHNTAAPVQLNVTKNDTAPGHLSNGNESTPVINAEKKIGKGKHKCDSMKEVDDMMNCYVTVHDNDDVIEKGTTLSPTGSTTLTTTTSNSSLENTTKPSVNESVHNTTQKSVETIIVPLNRTTINNVSSTTNHPMSTSTTAVLDTNTKVDTNNTTTVSTEDSVSSVAPLLGDSVRNKETEDVNGATKSTNATNSNSMSTGLIALVTMISFAIVIVIAYIGMVVWRRYVEYRYGHRQLLVNELEFDTNDLRHFEL